MIPAVFQPGVERFSEAGNVTDLGEASALRSTAGANGLAHALYRLPLGSAQPGCLCLDVNPLPDGNGNPAEFFVGLSDYSLGRWEWHGPFTEHHLRLVHATRRDAGGMSAVDYTSDSGNMFVTLLVSSGHGVDVVGLGLEPLDELDESAPDTPAGLSLQPLAAGLSLQWNPVIAPDLAGYRVHWSASAFLNPYSAGVQHLDHLEGSTRSLLGGLGGTLHVAISSVDCNGNESPPTPLESAHMLPGSPLPAGLQLSRPSCLRDEQVTLTVGSPGAGLLYDFDLDGDGSFELAGQSLPVQTVDTSGSGLIRPRVRITDAAGQREALGGLSLIVAGNQRPVASGLATPASGTAPLLVSFDGTGSSDFDGSITGGGWDFDGDGIFDSFDEESTAQLTGQFSYSTPGLYNARLRVIDDQGSWDVDTLAILVAEPGQNLPPQISLAQATPQPSAPGASVSFHAEAADPDGTVAGYAWDFDNDGTDDATGQDALFSFALAGFHNVRLRATDDDGAADIQYISVLVQGAPVNQPPVVLLSAKESDVLCGTGDASLQQQLDASASYDPEGGNLQYAFDTLGTGSFSAFGPDPLSALHFYTDPGTYFPAVRVLDEAGNITESHVAVQVRRLAPQLLESGNTLANTISIAAVEISSHQRIGIASYDSVNDDLRFNVSTDQTGLSWQPGYVVDANGGEWMSLAQGVSQFNLAYYRDGDLFFRASQNDGQSFNVSGIVDNSADDAGDFCSCAVIGNFPAIAYYNRTAGDLYYRRSTNTGSIWSSASIVDGTGDTGQYCSLQSVSANPAVAYYRADNGSLMYSRATNGNGTAWNSPLVLDGGSDDVGMHASLQNIVNDAGQARLAVAYYDSSNSRIKLVLSQDTFGLSWEAPSIVSSASNLTHLSLRQAGGHMLVVYGRSTLASVFFIQSQDLTGAAGWGALRNVEAASSGSPGAMTLRTDGQPALAYYDSAKELHFATARLD
ncbi:MAG: PKD domain-containing protein [bacterium]